MRLEEKNERLLHRTEVITLEDHTPVVHMEVLLMVVHTLLINLHHLLLSTILLSHRAYSQRATSYLPINLKLAPTVMWTTLT